MYAVIDIAIAAPEVGAHTAAVFDRMEGFGRIVAQHGERLKFDDVTIAELVEILGREVAIYAAADTVTFCANPDNLGNLYPAIPHDRDITVEFQDTLVGDRRQRQRQQHQAGQLSHSIEPSLTSGTFAASSAVF